MNQEQREALRTAVLNFMAERPANAFESSVLLQRVSRSGLLDFQPTPEELNDALAFLKGAKFVEVVPHALGATLFFQVTAEGVLASERGILNPRPQ